MICIPKQWRICVYLYNVAYIVIYKADMNLAQVKGTQRESKLQAMFCYNPFLTVTPQEAPYSAIYVLIHWCILVQADCNYITPLAGCDSRSIF